MSARDPETGRSLSDDDLVDLFLTLIVAGHETSANALTWTLYCLAAQPERQEALAAWVREVIGDGPVEAGHLEALGEIKQFLQEAMRLLPPVPILARRALRDCQAGVEPIRAGSLLFIPIYAIHRHRALWSEPEVFDPDRFGLAAERVRPRCAYMPFGAGPRICIGAGFATMEMIVGLASLLAKVRVRLGDEGPPRPVYRITLRPERVVVLRVERRG
jgi:cytochrome P450